MTFFKKEHKKLALSYSKEHLTELYKYSEKKLKESAKYGNDFALQEAMRKHQLFEYARLYQQTPQYKKQIRRKGYEK